MIWMNPSRLLRLFLCAGAASAVLASPCFGSGEAWRTVEPRDGDPEGYTFFVEETGDAYPGYKAEGWLEADPEEAALSAMVLMTGEEFVPRGQTRRILRRSDDELVLHTYIDMPVMVTDRELTIRITHTSDPATGVHRIEWASADDEAPPSNGDVVRISDARGFWEFLPEAPGRSRATYLTHADLGGWLPARMVSPLMRGQVAGDVARLQRALRKFAISAAPED
jgi:hypothetical protein